ncbi:MAG TPA: hypothetical protein VFR37_03480 [Longimicrobium sp.]|nr:hypothetical protein [Longimicrobium sp.]
MIIRFRARLSAALALAVLACGAPAAAQTGGRPPGEPPPTRLPPEEPPPPFPQLHGAVADSVRMVIYEYHLAIYERDGAAAVQRVTRASRGYYARMRDLAVTAPEAQVRAAPLMDRITILMLRHRVSPDELRALQGDAVFAYTVDHAWVNADTFRERPQPTDADVFGAGDRAVMLRPDVNTAFVREDGVWRLDLMPVLERASAEFAPDPDSGMTEDELVMMVLQFSDGREPSPDIWQPLP